MGDGYTHNIRTRTYRTSQIGDKFSSRHGQKGTVGLVLSEADNQLTGRVKTRYYYQLPHCIPPRMTIAQLKETVLGKGFVGAWSFW